MNSVNKTLYIPLYGKAFVSQKGIILRDKKAEEIWKNNAFPLKRKSKSKWLAYYMAMRSVVFDRWLVEKWAGNKSCTILHLGCGLDARAERVGLDGLWLDIDFPAVIDERKRYYRETESYRMISADLRNTAFVEDLPKTKQAIVIMEGVSMYLSNAEMQRLFEKINGHYESVCVLLDCYTPFGAKASKIKNPVKEVGVSKVFGIEKPKILEQNTGLNFVEEHEITPTDLMDELKGFEKFLFKHLYAGGVSKKIYKIYEYKKLDGGKI